MRISHCVATILLGRNGLVVRLLVFVWVVVVCAKYRAAKIVCVSLTPLSSEMEGGWNGVHSSGQVKGSAGATALQGEE